MSMFALSVMGFFGTIWLLSIGLITGEMPNSVGDINRATNPIFFWFLATTYAFCAAVCIRWIIVEWPWGTA
ncbi:hypothetical protein HY78_15970 [Rhizorhabdus wittichii DC-6]|jgi:hypothetical protein|nr:hypothetical protein HY78_15970 [Rhizorhabdus wittichii DC-6]